jgi:hypothetical protein
METYIEAFEGIHDTFQKIIGNLTNEVVLNSNIKDELLQEQFNSVFNTLQTISNRITEGKYTK